MIRVHCNVHTRMHWIFVPHRALPFDHSVLGSFYEVGERLRQLWFYANLWKWKIFGNGIVSVLRKQHIEVMSCEHFIKNGGHIFFTKNHYYAVALQRISCLLLIDLLWSRIELLDRSPPQELVIRQESVEEQFSGDIQERYVIIIVSSISFLFIQSCYFRVLEFLRYSPGRPT